MEKKQMEKPNVLFIAIDDLNDWVGFLGGHPDVITPHLDNLSERSVVFTNAHCAAPSCNPSRTALLTGIRPSTSGVYHNHQPWRKSPVLKDAITLPQHFMANGYKVLGSGKIFHGAYPDPPSWHVYWPSKINTRPPDPKPPEEKLPLNGFPKKTNFDWGPIYVEPHEMSDWQVADWVIQQLNSEHNDPFFLACGFFRPHLPWYVPKKYFDLYPIEDITLPLIKKNDLEDIPLIGKRIAKPEEEHKDILKHDQWRKAVQGYLASISFVDDCVAG